MKLMVIPIVNGAPGTLLKCLEEILEELKIGGRIKSLQTTVLSRWTRISTRLMKNEKTYRHSDSSERQPAYISVKHLQRENNDNNNNETIRTNKITPKQRHKDQPYQSKNW